MTPAMLKTLRLIDQSIRETGVAPSYREMRSALGLTSNAVIHRRIDKLKYAGLILKGHNLARAITITNEGYRQLRLRGGESPHLAVIAALREGGFEDAARYLEGKGADTRVTVAS